MMLKRRKTGKTRHRVETRFFKEPLVVLQVEWHITGYEIINIHGTRIDVNDFYWFDAQVEDITEITNE